MRRTRSGRPTGVETQLPEGDIRRQVGCRLSNIGSSCYQNVILQLLFNLPEVRDRLLDFSREHGSSSCDDPLCFPRDLAQHVVDAAEHAATGSPLSARWVLKYQQAAEHAIGLMYKQSDPADFLHAILDYCHDRATHKLSWLLELMQGEAYDREWVDRAAFPACEDPGRDLAVTPFLTLNVPLPTDQDSTLEQCLLSSVFEEKVVGGRECTCPHGRHAKLQQFRLKTVPRLLTLRLLRFDNSLRKVKSRISYPSRLDITAFTNPPNQHQRGGEGAGGPTTELELVAVTVHHGRTRQRGHYYTYIKVKAADGRSLWWLFDDDSRHCEVDETKVFAAQNEVYMLVYRRLDPQEEAVDDDKGQEASAAASSSSEATAPVMQSAAEEKQGEEEEGSLPKAVAEAVVKDDTEDGPDGGRAGKRSRL